MVKCSECGKEEDEMDHYSDGKVLLAICEECKDSIIREYLRHNRDDSEEEEDEEGVGAAYDYGVSM